MGRFSDGSEHFRTVIKVEKNKELKKKMKKKKEEGVEKNKEDILCKIIR